MHHESEKQTFISHVHELRKRLFFVALSVSLFGGLAYSIEKTLTTWLLKPAAGQQFIYTTPGGGFDFLFKLCLYAGIAASIPVIVYQLFRYIAPLLRYESRRFMLACTLWSSALGLVGIAFGYFFGLPAAMHFLLQGFSSAQISALITIQSYMSFVLVYLLGSALLFQIPLILLLINRIKPLSPRKLIKYQRWVIVAAFVAGAIISPTPDIRNQAILSGPVILMYEVSVLLIWITNRRHGRSPKVAGLLQNDIELRARRQAQFAEAQRALQTKLQTKQIAAQAQTAPKVSTLAPHPMAAKASAPTATAAIPIVSSRPASGRPAGYLQNFSRQQYALTRRPII